MSGDKKKELDLGEILDNITNTFIAETTFVSDTPPDDDEEEEEEEKAPPQVVPESPPPDKKDDDDELVLEEEEEEAPRQNAADEDDELVPVSDEEEEEKKAPRGGAAEEKDDELVPASEEEDEEVQGDDDEAPLSLHPSPAMPEAAAAVLPPPILVPPPVRVAPAMAPAADSSQRLRELNALFRQHGAVLPRPWGPEQDAELLNFGNDAQGFEVEDQDVQVYEPSPVVFSPVDETDPVYRYSMPLEPIWHEKPVDADDVLKRFANVAFDDDKKRKHFLIKELPALAVSLSAASVPLPKPAIEAFLRLQAFAAENKYQPLKAGDICYLGTKAYLQRTFRFQSAGKRRVHTGTPRFRAQVRAVLASLVNIPKWQKDLYRNPAVRASKIVNKKEQTNAIKEKIPEEEKDKEREVPLVAHADKNRSGAMRFKGTLLDLQPAPALAGPPAKRVRRT